MSLGRIATSLFLTAGVLAAVAAPASAHTELKSSDPARGASVAAVQQLTLTFSEPVTLPADAVTVTGPATWTVGTPAIAGAVVTVPVTPAGPAGAYTITWKVISADGDPVSGTIPFTLTAPVATTTLVPTTTTTTTSEAAPTSASGVASNQAPAESGGFPMWAWIVIGVVVLAGAGFFLVRKRG